MSLHNISQRRLKDERIWIIYGTRCTKNGKFSAFPTLPIASESKENLTQLKLAMLFILANMQGCWPQRSLWEDQFQNHGLGCPHFWCWQTSLDWSWNGPCSRWVAVLKPPSTDVSRAIIHVFQTIESAVGKDKLYTEVMVNTTTTHNNF